MSETRRGPLRRSAALLFLLALPLCGLRCPASPVDLIQVAEGLELPVQVTAPWGDPRLFVVEHSGRIRVVDPMTGAVGTFLDLRSRVGRLGEQGLWSVAFPPDYAETGLFYVFYQRGIDSIVSRFMAPDPAGDTANPLSEFEIIRAPMQGTSFLGGGLQFGLADGMLYIAIGEGAPSTSGGGAPQQLTRLQGKVLRIDVSGSPYTIPPDNPLVTSTTPGVRKEIWALGVRDPVRMDFDPATSDLWLADRGMARQEIHVLPAGAGGLNLGWPIHDGTLCARSVTGLPCETPATASRFSFPVHEYASGADCKAVGALPYGGGASWLAGRFLFADACSDHVFVLTEDAGAVEVSEPLGFSGMLDGVHSVSRDGFGEPYLTSRDNGRVYWVRLDADFDGDGILDRVDACPEYPSRQGCGGGEY